MTAHQHRYPDAAAAAEACAHHILGQLEEALAEQELATLAVSGGSTPRLLFQRLAAARFHWERVHLFWVDERCVAPSDPESNYRLAEENFIAPARLPRANVHRICGELLPEAAARRYVEEIRTFFGLNTGDLPRFDMVQCGLGPDAHTASLFPGEPLIADRERIAAAVNVAKLGKWRVTLLPGALLAAKQIAFLVSGQDKAEAVRAVFQEDYDPQRYPAQVLHHHGRHVTWFLDEAAAEGINES